MKYHFIYKDDRRKIMNSPFSSKRSKIVISSYSLDYFDGKKRIKTDVLAYRPDPRTVLEEGVIYDAELNFMDVYEWWDNKVDKNLVSIKLNSSKEVFSKIR